MWLPLLLAALQTIFVPLPVAGVGIFKTAIQEQAASDPRTAIPHAVPNAGVGQWHSSAAGSQSPPAKTSNGPRKPPPPAYRHKIVPAHPFPVSDTYDVEQPPLFTFRAQRDDADAHAVFGKKLAAAFSEKMGRRVVARAGELKREFFLSTVGARQSVRRGVRAFLLALTIIHAKFYPNYVNEIRGMWEGVSEGIVSVQSPSASMSRYG